MKLYLYLKYFRQDAEGLNDGASKAVRGLAAGLAACGVDTTVLCEGDRESWFQSPEGYTVACFANKNPDQPCFEISSGLNHYIQQTAENSLVILNGLFHRSVFGFSKILRQYSIPYVVAPHDPYHPSVFQKKPYLKFPYWYLFERNLLKQAKAVQVLNIQHAQWLHRLHVTTPIIEVPNGFASTDLYSESNLRWRESAAAQLLFLGRLDAHNKGLDILLDAFAQIAKKSDCKLTIQGPDKGDKKALQQQADRLELSEKVTFLEPDFDTPSPSIMANYDILCIPSRFEGFSLSALEAMLAGRVILISDVAGIAPHIQASGCGVVVKPEASAIEAGFFELLNRRSEWREMGLKGRNYALEHFQWNKIAARAIEHYRCLLAQ